MANQSQTVWGAVKGSLLSFFAPTQSEVEIKIAEQTREIKALQEYESLVDSFTAADDAKHQSVETALNRFKAKTKNS